MGFGLTYQMIDDRPVLFEVLHETEESVISVIITSFRGDKLRAVKCKKSLLNKEMYSSLFNLRCNIKSKSIIAAIPIKEGDIFISTKLNKSDGSILNEILQLRFFDKSYVSGPARSIEFDKVIDLTALREFTQRKSLDDKWLELSPAILISMFNVINPRNAVSYHLSCSK